MKYLLSFDPGLRCSGLALFEDGVLVETYLAEAQMGPRDAAGAIEMARSVLSTLEYSGFKPLQKDHLHFAYEKQQVYSLAGNADDLFQLAYVNGAVAYMLNRPSTGYLPREWKGQVPKRIHQPRIIKALTDEERAEMDKDLAPYTKSLRHNALDAVGIGLKYLRRM